jgi:putative transcriptional regulator
MPSLLDIPRANVSSFVCKEAQAMSTRRLGNRLKVARAERGISQEELAKLVGVTRQTISSIETGQYCPSTLLAFLLSERLNKPVDELFFLEGGSQ